MGGTRAKESEHVTNPRQRAVHAWHPRNGGPWCGTHVGCGALYALDEQGRPRPESVTCKRCLDKPRTVRDMPSPVPDDYFADWTAEQWAEVLDDPVVEQLLRITGLMGEVKANLLRLYEPQDQEDEPS
jgi:hypothetical protein